MEESTQTDPTMLQSLLGNSQASLIPESLVTMMIVSFVVLNILGVLFFVFYVIGIVRKWKVQSAVLDMRKDLAEIKTHLSAQPATSDTKGPAGNNRVIARVDASDKSQTNTL